MVGLLVFPQPDHAIATPTERETEIEMPSEGIELVEMVVINGRRYRKDDVPKALAKADQTPDTVAQKAARNAQMAVAGEYGDSFNAPRTLAAKRAGR